jgi:hypothetical protein
MKLGIMQPYMFPYIGYFQAMKAVDKYVVYDDVQFIKGGWINRNNILIGGNKALFTIQLRDASPNKLINEIEISDNFDKFLKTVSMAYSRAPYSQRVMELLERICSYPDKNLARFIENSFREITAYLNIDTELIRSSNLQKDNSLRAQTKVLAICKELGADTYINAIGGQSLYSKEDFAKEGIKLYFLKTRNVSYKQLGKEFVPWLSIIDIMMFNSPEAVNTMLDEYDLI